MNEQSFLQKQWSQVKSGGSKVLTRKIKKFLAVLLIIPFSIIAIPIVILIRLISPWYLVRYGALINSRIGHLAANTEIYLCEIDAGINKPSKAFLDVFFLLEEQGCNEQLLTMWKRVIRIGPSWILKPISKINRLIPGWKAHEIENTQSDRDIHNLLDRFPHHLSFTDEEEKKGKIGLGEMGIPPGTPFVCLLVRDSAYLQDPSWSYHNYRDCTIGNYVLVAEELAQRGYYVIRMGVKVHSNLESGNPMVIDYATNGMRSDFMDIYLGAKCSFCISTSSGWDAVPLIFRKPIAYAPIVPLGYFFTFSDRYIGITKHHIYTKNNKELSLSGIFKQNVGFSLFAAEYETKEVRLIENSPEEIRDVVMELEERLTGKWVTTNEEKELQNKFWKMFPVNKLNSENKKPLHGEIHARFGTKFLRNNPEWLS